MKHFSILFAALLLAAGAASAQGLPGEGARCAYPDSIVTYSYRSSYTSYSRFDYLHTFNADGTLQKDSVLMDQAPYLLYEYSYTADWRLASNCAYQWSKGDDNVYRWAKRQKYDLAYNADGLVADSIHCWAEGDQWAPEYRVSYTYSNGRVIDYIAYLFENSDWELYRRETYTYDSDGRKTGANYYNRENNQWILSESSERIYDAQGRLTVSSTTSKNSSVSRQSYTYDSDTTYYIISSWKGSGSDVFEEEDKTEVKTDAAGRIISKSISSRQSDGSRFYHTYYTYSYDAQGRVAEMVYFNRGTSTAWQGKKVTTPSYDALGNVLERWTYKYNAETEQFDLYEQYLAGYTYDYSTGFGSIEADAPRGQKIFRDGRFLIRRDGHLYDLNGRVIE